MARYTMKDTGYKSMRMIYSQGKKVGQVIFKNERKVYVAMMGGVKAEGTSFLNAFDMLFVKRAGFDSIDDYNADMAKKNAVIRESNHQVRAKRREMQRTMNDIFTGPATAEKHEKFLELLNGLD